MPIPKVDTHKHVRDKHWKSANRAEKKIGKDILDLWRERKDADYEDGATIDINRARTAHGSCPDILERLRSIGAV